MPFASSQPFWHLKNVGFSPIRLGLLAGAIALMCLAGLAAMTLAFRATEAQRWVEHTVEVRQLTGEFLNTAAGCRNQRPRLSAVGRRNLSGDLQGRHAEAHGHAGKAAGTDRRQSLPGRASAADFANLRAAQRSLSADAGPCRARPARCRHRPRQDARRKGADGRSAEPDRGVRQGRTRNAGHAGTGCRPIADDADGRGDRCAGLRHRTAAVLRQDELRLRPAARFSHRRTGKRGAAPAGIRSDPDPGAEDGGRRPAHRRHRARLQQHADGDHRQSRNAAAPSQAHADRERQRRQARGPDQTGRPRPARARATPPS